MGVAYDERLLEKVKIDISLMKRRTAIYSLLSLILILSEISFAVFATMSTAFGEIAIGYSLSAAAALILTIDAALAVQQRAIGSHTALRRLIGIQNTMLYATSETSPLWDEYTALHSERRVSYIDGVLLFCT